MSQFFAWGGQNIGVSASASVLPMNNQDWSPWGWTCWIYLQSKGLSRVFSNTTVQKHQFFGAQLSSQSNSHIHTWPLEKTIDLTRRTFVGKVMSLQHRNYLVLSGDSVSRIIFPEKLKLLLILKLGVMKIRGHRPIKEKQKVRMLTGNPNSFLNNLFG